MARSAKRHPAGSRRGGQFASDLRGTQPPVAPSVPGSADEPAEPDKNDLMAIAEAWLQLHQDDEDLHEDDFEELEWANTYHLRFTRFNERTLAVTDELLRLRPSRLTPEEQQRVFSEWLASVAAIYKMRPVALVWDEQAALTGGGYYRPSEHSLTLNPRRPSVITLLHEMRHALQHQACGAPMITDDVERDARAWSLSLYFQVRPEQFERLVRGGQIRFVDRRVFGD